MNQYREKLIALLEAEISLLKESDLPIELLNERTFFSFKRESYWLGELQEEIHQLSKQVNELSKIRKTCALSSESEGNEVAMQLLTGLPNKGKQERKYLDRQLHGALKLTISDPYFFSWSGPNKIFEKESKYTDFILELIPKTVQQLEIFHLPGANSRILHKFKQMINSR